MPKFRTTIDADGENGAWATITIPLDVPSVFDSTTRVAVQGTINGYEFRSSIMPRADGTFYMMVNKAMRAGARVQSGDLVIVEMERDDGPREIAIPPELSRALDADAAVRARYDELSYSHRKEYADWIASAKQPETRARRAGKAVAALLEGRALKH
jgi:hypothetical protein